MLGVTLVDVMNEFHRYSREKGCIPAVLSASRGLTLSCTGLLPIPGEQCTSASSARQKPRNMPLKAGRLGAESRRRRTNTVAGTGSGEQPEAIPTNHVSRQQGFTLKEKLRMHAKRGIARCVNSGSVAVG
nr:Uncharacterised protein [Klebsiella pneumoniae]